LLPKIGGTHLSTDFFNTITIRAAFQFGELVRTSRSSSQLHALPCDLCAGAVQCYRDDPNAEARAGGDAVTVPDLYWRRVRGGPCFPALVDRKEPGPKLNSMSSCSHANMAVNATTLGAFAGGGGILRQARPDSRREILLVAAFYGRARKATAQFYPAMATHFEGVWPNAPILNEAERTPKSLCRFIRFQHGQPNLCGTSRSGPAFDRRVN